MRRRLYEAGLYSRIAVKKPFLRKQNNVKRPQWTKAHKNWTIELWKKILWIDKSKFEIFESNRRVYVQWKVGERAETPCITPTVKHGRGFGMVWGAFTNCNVRDLYQLSANWIKLSQHTAAILSGMQLVGQGFVLMQDSDPKHTSKLC